MEFILNSKIYLESWHMEYVIMIATCISLVSFAIIEKVRLRHGDAWMTYFMAVLWRVGFHFARRPWVTAAEIMVWTHIIYCREIIPYAAYIAATMGIVAWACMWKGRHLIYYRTRQPI